MISKTRFNVIKQFHKVGQITHEMQQELIDEVLYLRKFIENLEHGDAEELADKWTIDE